MDEGQVSFFLSRLGCSKIRARTGWVNATCPFGIYHRKGKDTIASFGISISPGDMSRCRCQACGVSGSLIALIWRLENLGQDHSDLLPFLLACNQFDVEKLSDDKPKNGKTLSSRLDKAANQQWGALPGKTYIENEFEKQQAEVPEAVLEKMRERMTDDVRSYLRHGRGLHPLTVENWELGWHPGEDRLCVPIRDRDGKLVSVSGRALVRDDNGNWTDDLPEEFPSPKYLHSPFSRNKILYGMDKIVTSQRVGYLFEGFFQPIFSWQCGYNNVLGRMGTHLSAQGRDMLRQWFDKLVLVPDGDHAGYQSCDQIKRELEGELNRIPEIVIAPMVEGKDADECSEDLLKELLGPPNR